MEPGGFVVPGAPGAPTRVSAIPVRPGTGPPGSFIPPPPQVTYPQPTQPYAGVVPPVVPHGYRTPTPSESPVFPSPPSREGGGIFIPDPPPARGSMMGLPPQVYRPPIPVGEEELFIPPSPSRTPSSPPRSPSLIPMVPGPQIMPQQAAPPVLVYPPSQPSRMTRTPSSERSRTPSPMPGFPSGGQPTIINIPPQPGLVPPAIPLAPSTQPPFDGRGEPPMLAPGMMPPVQFVPTTRRERSEPSDFEGRREPPQQSGQQPIIIHPPAQTVTPGPFAPPIGPVVPGMVPIVGAPPRSRTYSPSLTTSRTPSPRRASFYGPGPPLPQPSVFPAPFPVGMQPVGIAPMGGPGPPIAVVAPSRGSPTYRSPTRGGDSPRLYPSPSRAPSRYSERVQPMPAMMPVPTAVHIEPSPYPSYRRGRTRYSGSRTPSSERDRSDSRERRRRRRGRRGSPGRSRSPSFESEDRRRSRYGSPSVVYPAPGPEFDRGVGPTVLPPPAVTHVHTYPPRSPSGVSERLTEREFEPEPLPHPSYPPPSQYLPPEQVLVPTGRAPSGRTRASRAPTIVEVTGPEPIHVLPPDHGRPRTESFRKCSMYTQRLLLIGFQYQPINPLYLDMCLDLNRPRSRAKSAARVRVFHSCLDLAGQPFLQLKRCRNQGHMAISRPDQ